MKASEIADLSSLDAAIMLPLNNAHADETSALDAASLTALLDLAFYARGIDRGATALLIALDQNARYDSPNFLWFDRSLGDFVYVDRVVVAPAFRGRRLADHLYDDFEGFARTRGVSRITCEVNVEPPNPASLRFHARRGFREIGRLPYGEAKIVALLELTL